MTSPHEISPQFTLSPKLTIATSARNMFRRVRAATVSESISPNEMQDISQKIS